MKYLAEEYGKVLFELGIGKEACRDFNEKLNNCKELYSALDNPTISKKEKHRVIDKVFNSGIVPFVKCLCDMNCISLYRDIYRTYIDLVNDSRDILTADFICVSKPDKAELDRVKAMLMKKYNKKEVILNITEDKSLIGGFILKVGDTQYDKSIKGTVNNLKRKLEWR